MKNYMKKFATLLTTLTLVVVLGVCLSACGSSSKELSKEEKEEYVANLEKAEYSPRVTEGEENKESLEMKISETETLTAEWSIYASKGEDATYSMVTIIKFSNTDDAKKAEKATIAQLEERFKDIPEDVTEEEIAEAKKGSVIDRVGSVCFMGYQTAIDAAQGK